MQINQFQNRVLSLEQMKDMPIEQVLYLFNNGYRLSEKSDIIKSLQDVCPTAPIPKGTTKNIKVDVTTLTTPPYTFNVLQNDQPLYTYTGTATETSKTWVHPFNTAGTFTIKQFVKDSCPIESGGPKSSTPTSCTVTVEEAITPPGPSPIPILLGIGLIGAFLATK